MDEKKAVPSQERCGQWGLEARFEVWNRLSAMNGFLMVLLGELD